MNRLTLEQRVAHLERLIKNEAMSYVSYEELLEAATEAVESVGTDYQDVVDEIYNTYGWEEGEDYKPADLNRAILDAGGDSLSGEDLEDAVRFWFDNNASPSDIPSRKKWLQLMNKFVNKKRTPESVACMNDSGTNNLKEVMDVLSVVASEYLDRYNDYMNYGWEDHSGPYRFSGVWSD